LSRLVFSRRWAGATPHPALRATFSRKREKEQIWRASSESIL
jgi:hypothetical protein